MMFQNILKATKKFYNSTDDLKTWFIKDVLNKPYTPKRHRLYEKYVDFFDQNANDYCLKLLESNKPCMISKFGSIELINLIQYKSINQKHYSFSDYIDFIKGVKPTLWWNCGITALCNNAGFFPNDYKLLPDFFDVYYNSLKKIDILGSYKESEKYFEKELSQAKKVNIDGYYAPFFYNNPWTKVLQGKKVLVIHPFEKSIRTQYAKRQKLWDNKDILPEFKLITIKSEQTMLNQPSQYKDWFEALESMKIKMKNIDFDIALIGCGAYGMPLASYAKTLGKQAVHLAGWTQILFGIKGKRWEDMPEMKKYINNHWINPLDEEKPTNFKNVEKGCYW